MNIHSLMSLESLVYKGERSKEMKTPLHWIISLIS